MLAFHFPVQKLKNYSFETFLLILRYKTQNRMEMLSLNGEVYTINQLLFGTQALVMIFMPYCFGDIDGNSIESLIVETNERLDDFLALDLRVVCIGREPPSTMRHWMADRNIRIEVFSDSSLIVSNEYVGSFDLGNYLKGTQDVHMGSFMTCMPAVVVLGCDGHIVSKYIASSPGKSF
jgi:hypothetical protein